MKNMKKIDKSWQILTNLEILTNLKNWKIRKMRKIWKIDKSWQILTNLEILTNLKNWEILQNLGTPWKIPIWKIWKSGKIAEIGENNLIILQNLGKPWKISIEKVEKTAENWIFSLFTIKVLKHLYWQESHGKTRFLARKFKL